MLDHVRRSSDHVVGKLVKRDTSCDQFENTALASRELVRLALPRKVAVPVLAEAAHEIEESHHQHGMTTAVSVERHAGDDDRPRRPGGYRNPGNYDGEGDGGG